jgi:hypothetical protein
VTGLGSWNLIVAFNYYLVLVLVVGTAVRARNYLAMIGLVARSVDRWPKLRALVATHRGVFLRWPTVLPVAATLALTLSNAWATRFVWSHARVTACDLRAHPLGLAAVAAAGGLMAVLDFRIAFLFGRFDGAAAEAVLDRAEHWLGSWTAPAVRVLTAGLINPRRIVGEEVRLALVDACLAMNGQLWALSLGVAAQLAFGLALWVTWAVALRS